MTEINERVTVEFDEQSYYLDGEYWESWDNYGEEMADAINKLLNDLAEENKELKNDEKQLSIDFLGYKMKLGKVLQRRYDKAKGQTLYADVFLEIAEEMRIDLE